MGYLVNDDDSTPRGPSVQTRVQSASLAALHCNVLGSDVGVGSRYHTVTSSRDLFRCKSSARATEALQEHTLALLHQTQCLVEGWAFVGLKEVLPQFIS